MDQSQAEFRLWSIQIHRLSAEATVPQKCPGERGSFVLKGGDATQGQLATMYSGPRPYDSQPGRYNPMKKQGAIILGTGGDQSNSDRGNFYEGYMTAGATSDATDDAVQANILAVGYTMEAGENLAQGK